MRAVIFILALALSGVVAADQYVRGYVRQDGTYVAPHYRSSPNQYRHDNYSSQGNTNPYTGQRGYRSHEFSTPRSLYSNPQYNQNRR